MSPRRVAEQHLLEMLGERLCEYFPAKVIDHPGIWVSCVFQQLREAIANGDKVAVSIACDLIEHDPHLPFGKLIKSGLSRELRRHTDLLLSSERRQIIDATAKLLSLEFAPRELEDYARLVARLPRNEFAARIGTVTTQSEKASRLKEQLLGER